MWVRQIRRRFCWHQLILRFHDLSRAQRKELGQFRRGDSDKYKLPARAQLTSTPQSTQSCKHKTWRVRLSSVQQIQQNRPGTARCLHPPILVLGWGPPDPDFVNLLRTQREADSAGQARRAQVPKGQCSGRICSPSHLIFALPLAGHGGG